ncbi:MAG: hypothetical protein M1836_003753 [Candelina mexicana]|nr:MAG: hypothetical protein M1836_003753 [Candelina mexicana]
MVPAHSKILTRLDTLLLYSNLDVTNQGMPQQYANLSKNGSIPDVSGGFLWEDNVNKIFYLFGGEYDTQPDGFSVWGYDTILNQWNSTSGSTLIQRVAYGAGASVSERGEGYYLGGWLSNKTVPGWSGSPIATSNLIRYDMTSDSYTNNTGPSSTGRAEGVLLYLPASDGGLLIYFGGVMTPYGNSTTVGAPMDQINIYDIASGKWYTQNATGTVPEPRARFCAGATWAEDKSSYNIYLYGGMGVSASNLAGFDDVYILTLPSFTWIKWFPTDSGPGNPHHTLTCNVINNAQMLIMGGTFPLTDQCDAQAVYGQHNLNLGKDNSENAKWALFNPNMTKYKVPSEIIAVVGGGASGGATKKSPDKDWNHRDLPVYFQRQATISARTATRALPTATAKPAETSAPAKKSNTGAIAGGAVGGAVVLLAVVAGIVICLRKRKANATHRTFTNAGSEPYAASGAQVHETQELPANPTAPPYEYKDPARTSINQPYGAHPHSPPLHHQQSSSGMVSPPQPPHSPTYYTPNTPQSPSYPQSGYPPQSHYSPPPQHAHSEYSPPPQHPMYQQPSFSSSQQHHPGGYFSPPQQAGTPPPMHASGEYYPAPYSEPQRSYEMSAVKSPGPEDRIHKGASPIALHSPKPKR